MQTNDPDQLDLFDLFSGAEIEPVATRPVDLNQYVRVQDKLNAAAAANQSLIRLQPGYSPDRPWSAGQPWVIKVQSKEGPYANGWKYFKKFDPDQGEEAQSTYAKMLESGEYAEG